MHFFVSSSTISTFLQPSDHTMLVSERVCLYDDSHIMPLGRLSCCLLGEGELSVPAPGGGAAPAPQGSGGHQRHHNHHQCHHQRHSHHHHHHCYCHQVGPTLSMSFTSLLWLFNCFIIIKDLEIHFISMGTDENRQKVGQQGNRATWQQDDNERGEDRARKWLLTSEPSLSMFTMHLK